PSSPCAMSSWLRSVQAADAVMLIPFPGSYRDANVVVAAAEKRLSRPLTAVLVLPNRSYTSDTRGDQSLQIGRRNVLYAGTLAKRPACAGWPVTCSLRYSKRNP